MNGNLPDKVFEEIVWAAEKCKVQKVILFGSRARGTNGERSDIDIAVVVDEVPDDYLGAVAALWRLTRCVDSAIEPVLLTEADNDSGFLQTVRRTGIAV